jgi:hypothetical protein
MAESFQDVRNAWWGGGGPNNFAYAGYPILGISVGSPVNLHALWTATPIASHSLVVANFSGTAYGWTPGFGSLTPTTIPGFITLSYMYMYTGRLQIGCSPSPAAGWRIGVYDRTTGISITCSESLGTTMLGPVGVDIGWSGRVGLTDSLNMSFWIV